MHIDDEGNARIAKASAAFGRLRGSIWDRSGVRLDTKLKVYRSVVLSTLLYTCETWTVYQRQIEQDRTKWRGLIKREAGEYEAKRISETEQKRAQRKARAKASPTELSSSDLSCSICNRQFRAKIGLISHPRTHK